MSSHEIGKTQAQTKNKLDSGVKLPEKFEAVANLASSALRSAAYEAIQQPLNSLGQFIDHYKPNAHAGERLQLIAPVQQSRFGSLKWHAEQIGAAIGQVVPYLASRSLVKPFFAEGSLLSKTNILTRESPLRFSIAEGAATGFVSAALFHPVQDSDNFWSQKFIDGGKSAVTMAALTASTHGLARASQTELANKFKASNLLKNSFVSGVISGAPAGVLGAEMDSIQHQHQFASFSDVEKSVYGMSMVGGTFGVMAMRAKAPDFNENLETPSIPQGRIGEQLSFNFEPERQISLEKKPSGAERTISRSEASIVASEPVTEDRQIEFRYPEPLTPVGQRAYELLQHLEALSDEENAKVTEGKYPITLHEAQAMHVLLDEWGPGAGRICDRLADRGFMARSMAYDAWSHSSLSSIKADMPTLYERALIKAHPEYDEVSRDKFVGHYFSKPLGIESAEEADRFLNAWNRSGPFSRWLDYSGDIHCPTLLKMIRWGHVDEIPDVALKPIAEHYKVYGEPFNDETDVQALIAAAPGWAASPLLPIDVATELATMPPEKRLAADAAVIATRDQFDDRGDSVRVFFAGKDAEAGRAAFFKNVDQLSQLSPRAILKKTQWEDNLSLAIDILHGDAISPEHKFALLQGLNSFQKAPQILATMDVSTFKQAYDKLIADNPVENDYDAKRYFDWQARSAVTLATVFKKSWPEWLESQEKAGRDNFQATKWLQGDEPVEFKGLAQFLMQHSKKSVNQLAKISNSWSEIRESGKVTNFSEALNVGLLTKYKTIKDASFAEEASRWDVPADKYGEYERRFIASKDVPSPFPLDERWTVGSLTGRFIPRDDPRGLFLGEHTNCCQRPDGNGESSAWYGQESPQSGYFVVEDPDGGIVSQSWAVVTDSGGMIFDNVEAKGLEKRQEAVKKIYQQAANSLTSRFHTVTLGTENSDLDLTGMPDAGDRRQSMPASFSGYTDARFQVLLASSDTVSPAEFERPLLRGALNLDKPAMGEISRQRSPVGWQALPWDKATRGMVLDHKTDGVIGYALYEPGNRYVSDIAVKPGIHPKYGHNLTASLFRTLRETGGDWTADLRSSTTYRMLQRAAKTGLVRIISDVSSEEPMGKEEMHHVVFNVDRAQESTNAAGDS